MGVCVARVPAAGRQARRRRALDTRAAAAMENASVWCAHARGSLGLQSVSSEQMDSSTLDTVSAGLHWSLRMSRQMPPLLLMLQW